MCATPGASADSLEAWGTNDDGALGDGFFYSGEGCFCSRIPVPVAGLHNVQAVAGGSGGLALLQNGTVMSWGLNSRGQLGDGTRENRYYAGPVTGLTGVKAIAAEYSIGMALLEDGEVMAWGEDLDGEVGNGSTSEAVLAPVRVVGLHEVTAIAPDMALLKNGTVMDWGNGAVGELGDGEFERSSDVPVQVQGLTEVKAIASDGGHRLALRKNGTVWAWGENEYGELGDGTTEASAVPVEVSRLSKVVAISDGAGHNLALLSSGKVMAWGANDSGQLGVGTTKGPQECGPFSCSTVPVTVHHLKGVTAIATGYGFGLALSNGTVYSWGENLKGQLGNGTGEAGSNAPLPVKGLSEPIGIAAGDEFSYAHLAHEPEEPPTITGVTPSEGPQFEPTELTISGTGFRNVHAVWFGGEEQRAETFTVVSETEIKAVAPTNFAGGPVRVSVATRAGLTPSTPADIYTYVAQFGPSVYAVEPDTGPEAGGTVVMIRGERLWGATAVDFGSKPAASFTPLSGSTIEATSPPGVGAVDVTVTTPKGTSGIVRDGDLFTYGPPPTLTRIGPHSGSMAGGTTIKITGTNLQGTTAVHFGSAAAAEFTVESAGSMTATSPAGTAGRVDVTVTTQYGTSPVVAQDRFRYKEE
jgi:alpha-tubulin suppressor-like RCC1 family protein